MFARAAPFRPQVLAVGNPPGERRKVPQLQLDRGGGRHEGDVLVVRPLLSPWEEQLELPLVVEPRRVASDGKIQTP